MKQANGAPSAAAERKSYFSGTHRVCAPERTVEKCLSVAARVGITRLADITGLDYIGIPVYQAIRPNSRSLSVSQGKGTNRAAAKASALMECIELWHAERVDLPLRYGSAAELGLRERRTIPLEKLPRRRGRSFAPGKPLYWVAGNDLITGGEVYVPFDFVSLDMTTESSESSPFSVDSNGLASGNVMAEAILHALYELIERDATTLALLAGEAFFDAHKLRPTSVTSPALRELLDRFTNADIAVNLWDVTGETEIPTYMASLVENEHSAWRRLGISWGWGCHVSSEVAISRALTEAAQSRLTLIAGSRDNILTQELTASKGGTAPNAWMDRCMRSPATRDYVAMDATAGTLTEDLDSVLQRLRNCGVDGVVAVDLTREDIGINVVKVIVPGFEGFAWEPRFTPGHRAQERLARSES